MSIHRRIVICNDGTWNTPDDRDRGKRKPTNITKISRAVKPVDSAGVSQLTFYDEGVGTGWGQKYVGGITGLGLSANVLDSYRFISNNYVPGDEIYIFGFSRGAYTSRSLCGLLSLVGLVLKDDVYYLPELYRFYRDGASKEQILAFYQDKQLTRYSPRIKMIGVFDTVGSLGIPLGAINRLIIKAGLAELQFHDVSLSDTVDHAYHALAIDEKRVPFKPTLWDSATPKTIELEQRWFCGVHSNIGGGYNPDGLANIPLKYMVSKAEKCGLEFDNEYLGFFQGRFDHELRDSMSLKYRLLGKHLRKINQGGPTNEVIDDSVHERILKVDNYKPDNVK